METFKTNNSFLAFIRAFTRAFISIVTFFVIVVIFNLAQIYLNLLVFFNHNDSDVSD